MRERVISWAVFLLLSAAQPLHAQELEQSDIPAIPGIEVTLGETAVIPGANNSIAFQFNDGRIVVTGDDHGVWSSDGGRTWAAGPKGPTTKTAIDLGDGEVLSFGSSMGVRADGVPEMNVARSTDDGATWQSEKAPVSLPETTPLGGDDGTSHSGMFVHHGALRLDNGDLMITLYGNYAGDEEFADTYPIEFNMRKYRTVVVTSADEGRTWGNARTVAYNTMLARGLDTDSHVVSYTIVPAVTQEGFGEPDITRAPNGDIVCTMRSGGRIPVGIAPIFPTPMYVSRSSDEGRTWTPPVQVADRGVCPYLVTLDNGVIVCSYARPGGWLIFSDDNGETWKGAFQICASDSYCNVLAVGPDEVLALYHSDGKIKGTHFTVTPTDQANQ